MYFPSADFFERVINSLCLASLFFSSSFVLLCISPFLLPSVSLPTSLLFRLKNMDTSNSPLLLILDIATIPIRILMALLLLIEKESPLDVDLIRFYFILFYFILFYFILFILFYFILFYFILFYFILFYFILFYFILFYFILFYFILFYFILFYFILFYFILFILFYFILFYFIINILFLFHIIFS